MSGRGIASGTFEVGKFESLSTLIREGDVFWDVGAHYGYASLIGAKRVGQRGAVVALEPSSHNRWYLDRHLRWEGSDRARILPFALANRVGTEAFGGESRSSVAQKLGEGPDTVEVRTFASLLDDGVPFPDVMKIDIEGAESRALAGVVEVLTQSGEHLRPSIMCSIHDPDQFELCLAALHRLRYRVIGSTWYRDFVSGTTPWVGDPDLLAVAPGQADVLATMRRSALFADGPDL